MSKQSLSLIALGLGLGLSASYAPAQTVPSNGVAQGANGNGSTGSSSSFLSSPMQLRGLVDTQSTDLSDGVGDPASTNAIPANVPPSYPIQPVQPVQPLQSSARTAEELDPYDPVGIAVGSFTLYPSLTLWNRFDDNVDNSRVGENGMSGRAEGEVVLRSDWSRHRLEVTGRAAVTGYNTPKRKPDHTYGLNGELLLDVANETTLTLRSGLDISREDANSVELRASGGQRSIQTVLSSDAQLDHRIGLFELQLRGGLIDESFDEDKSRDFQLFTVGTRVGYRFTDQVTPFVDLEASRRKFDRGPNVQDGDRLRGAIGIAVNNREKWSGELSVGQVRWKPDATGQQSDQGFYADANLVWSPNALWDVNAGFTTSISSTSTAATSVLTHSLDMGVDYAIKRDITLRADAVLTRQAYNGIGRTDWLKTGTLAAEYNLSRSLQVIGRYQHERRTSTLSSEGFSSNLFEFGLRLQK
ncbi:MAG: outer membrane beta-barrel protein [Cohaesibacter sp.]|nr:outer membrane beta-barrel protein [Cohaesibacter sp.]